MSPVSVFDCNIIRLGSIVNRAGNITIVENEGSAPFATRRVFYIYDIPGGESRGAHAMKSCHQLLIAASGSFEVQLDDGLLKKRVRLNRPFLALHIPPMIWASEINFSSGAICLVLASEAYDPGDYIRDYNDYLSFRKSIASKPA